MRYLVFRHDAVAQSYVSLMCVFHCVGDEVGDDLLHTSHVERGDE